MIARLRTGHRRWWIVLAISIPVLLWVALSSRESIPTVEELPVSAGERP